MPPAIFEREVQHSPNGRGVVALKPSMQWKGNDGNWSTFVVRVGSPSQKFELLPAVDSSKFWLPNPELACNGSFAAFQDCSRSRGIHNATIDFGESSSWIDQGAFTLPGSDIDGDLVAGAWNASFGTDRIELDLWNSTDSLNISQLISSYTDGTFWLGLLGLGNDAFKLDTLNITTSGILSTLKEAGKINSLSYGYTAGAHYVYTHTFGSLTLGGYDRSQLEGQSVQFEITDSKLDVPVRQLSVSKTLQGSQISVLPPQSISMRIDSSVSELWLPGSACDSLKDALNLTEDHNTGLFVMGSAIHTKLRQLNPDISLTIGQGTTDEDSISLRFPYGAFDRFVGEPFYGNDESFASFPIRRAANASQYVLGRTFLQEAYIVVDWERNIFNVSQTSHETINRSLVPIPAPGKTEDRSLNGGGVAGIVISCLFLAIALFAAWIWKTYRSRRQAAAELEKSNEDDKEEFKKLELDFIQEAIDRKIRLDSGTSELDPDNGLQELHSKNSEQELMSTQILEMEGDIALQELGVQDNLVPVEAEPASSKDETSVHELEA